MQPIERIEDQGVLLAIVVHSTFQPSSTAFVTPDEANLQLGWVVNGAGAEIQRHDHVPLERHLVGTAEVLVVQKGLCEVDIYDRQRALVATRRLSQGDVLLMVGGGHGFRMLEETTLLEIKQGPYTGVEEKERF